MANRCVLSCFETFIRVLLKKYFCRMKINNSFVFLFFFKSNKFPLGSKLLILASQTSRINNYNSDQCRSNQLEKDLKFLNFYKDVIPAIIKKRTY